ncbi:ABC transporter permease [Rhizobium rhizogenes]|uniref:Sugar ABC transporter n=1 Tax=Rhizobium rhizogenes (strain K84 / ATCC BAA-868) TaxID=311403 RepID=B9JM48_RHIR8|nr:MULTISPECIES: ABC transporter permease [Rhizobium]ACM28762.1 sugar ABC transporter [Rhizobium rhizogenes K84]OCJ18974.1 sugar ABC transporter [Agrobacterium sp. B131/95]EJK88058.1 permease component of ribose/xylose/arabinose/galactoside ABC-type transporter [Rhizobium sp. AP16]NTI24434.1 ABC transporter permease [Rhizobium rhizogenes]NTI43754.1 ABC transporter permease [Rhizobium rhizogenes]
MVRTMVRRVFAVDEIGLILGLVILILLVGLPNPALFSLGSIKSILRDGAFVAIMAFGMVYLIAMIEIDLSVGAIYAVCAMLAALMIKAGYDPWLGALAALAFGIFLGAMNAWLTILLDVPLIIITLGTQSVFLGFNLIISGAHPVFGLPKDHLFFVIFGGEFLGLPAPTWVMLFIGIVMHIVLYRSRFGATVRAIGSNRSAAEFIGIRLNRVRIIAMAIMGFLCALSGVLTMAYFKAVDPGLGIQKEMQVIAAVVIGGTSLAGGSGTLVGALLGVLIISIIQSGIVFFGVDPNYGRFITGVVIVLAIALDRILKRRRMVGAH